MDSYRSKGEMIMFNKFTCHISPASNVFHKSYDFSMHRNLEFMSRLWASNNVSQCWTNYRGSRYYWWSRN